MTGAKSGGDLEQLGDEAGLCLHARRLHPRPQDLETVPPATLGIGFPRTYWVYLAGTAFVAAGFADYPLIAYHFGQAEVVPGEWIAVLYAVAMAVSGAGSLASVGCSTASAFRS